MKCSDLKTNLFLYGENGGDRGALDAHLDVCPLCRQTHGEALEIRTSLRQMRRPEISQALVTSLKNSIRVETRSGKRAWPRVAPGIREWFQMRVMPYGVGVLASVLIGFTFLSMMFSGMLKPGDLPMPLGSGESSVMLASNSIPFHDRDSTAITPSEYARTRLGLGSESPSINPQGALIALTKSLVRGDMKDDEVVVVADVFGDGLAKIAEVVEPSRDRRAVAALQKALESDAAFAAFVPTTLENRPDNVRVILKFQSVNVSTSSKGRQHSH